jgi:hypothetical protein
MKYQHRYMAELTCVKISATARGWKVLQTETRGRYKPKVKQTFYDDAHFHPDYGVWIKVA